MLIKNNMLLFWRNADAYSNWYHSPSFTLGGATFEYGEQAMMWLKAKLFNDDVTAQRILDTKYPWDVKDKDGNVVELGHKSLGRLVKNYDDSVWVSHREAVMDEVTYAKFNQIAELKEGIIASFPLRLVEASPYDRIWGIGLEETNTRAWDEATWPKGVLNLLGESCQRTRNRILNEMIP